MQLQPWAAAPATALATLGGLLLFWKAVNVPLRKFLLRLLLRRNLASNPSKPLLALTKIISGKKQPLFFFQDALPSLPVPTLSQTCARFLNSVKPLLSPEEFKQTEILVKEFEAGEGKELQSMLEARAKKNRNWLSEWWLEFAYLRFRGPIAINISFWGIDVAWKPPPVAGQVSRATDLISRALYFKNLIDTERLPPFRVNNILPLDMDGYRYMFGTTRIPGRESDKMRTFSAVKDAHVLLIIGSHLFKLQVLKGGKAIERSQIEGAIRKALINADDKGRWTKPNISALTTENRTTWAEAREHIMKLSVRNSENMEMIEQALFSVVLHEGSPANRFAENPTQGINDINWKLFYSDGKHYWFDKCFSMVIFENGRAGMNVEHTWADAPVPCHMSEYIFGVDCPGRLPEVSTAVSAELLDWDVDLNVETYVSQAHEHFSTVASQTSLRSIIFDGFGKEFAKKNNLSPDAFCQAVLQMASIRHFQRPVLTYESAATRLFYMGRTETIRSASPDMVNFASEMKKAAEGKAATSKKERREMLSKAAKAHTKLARDAGLAQGVDRHLLGLKIMALVSGRQLPKMFLDCGYNQDYLLSTSQTPLVQQFTSRKADDLGLGGGFGPTAANGVGVSYHVLPDQLYFHISANGTEAKARCENFESLVHKALSEMKELFTE